MNDRSGSGAGRKRAGRSNAQSKQPAKRKSRGRGRSKKVDPVKYWGDRDLLRVPEDFVTDTPDTSVVVASLGRPPIPGHENASKHYFSLVYDKAAALAVALAAAGRLDEMVAADQLELDDDDIDGNRLEESEGAADPNRAEAGEETDTPDPNRAEDGEEADAA